MNTGTLHLGENFRSLMYLGNEDIIVPKVMNIMSTWPFFGCHSGTGEEIGLGLTKHIMTRLL